ncbi:BTE_HP_G0152950.mRNA.1.CDS.1 [Saccharomyces cerevisiae]|nr:BTE_HP_G0152950.mRNA.1.CDS.1 [Saccharomyces cerevisiae]CAI7010000.1 BTE_HP_G0152950.mRNA.1.CDS.1 [Saccharomyces cerevisiae]
MDVADIDIRPQVKDLEKVTLSSKQDAFFRDTMYLNFGELGDKYPEFRKLSGNVAKHMAIVGELDRQLKIKNIWEISEIEQNLSAHDANEEDFSDLIKLLQNEAVDKYYKLKLACIYSLNNQTSSDKIRQLVEILSQQLPPEDVNFFHKFKSLFSRQDKMTQ